MPTLKDSRQFLKTLIIYLEGPGTEAQVIQRTKRFIMGTIGIIDEIERNKKKVIKFPNPLKRKSISS